MYIRDLKCNQGHVFEWFFATRTDMQIDLHGGLVVCPVCENTDVKQEACSPRVNTESRTVPLHVQKQIASYREHIYRTAEDVGNDLFKVSKAIKMGEQPDRPLVGSCSLSQAVELKINGANLRPMPPIMDIEKN